MSNDYADHIACYDTHTLLTTRRETVALIKRLDHAAAQRKGKLKSRYGLVPLREIAEAIAGREIAIHGIDAEASAHAWFYERLLQSVLAGDFDKPCRLIIINNVPALRARLDRKLFGNLLGWDRETLVSAYLSRAWTNFQIAHRWCISQGIIPPSHWIKAHERLANLGEKENAPTHSRMPGRPPCSNLAYQEYEKRVDSGAVLQSIAKEAAFLRAFVLQKFPKEEHPETETIRKELGRRKQKKAGGRN